ncbi:hypothetical protein LINGRAHAP2_LOCUS15736 [Linum grandiflorum]
MAAATTSRRRSLYRSRQSGGSRPPPPPSLSLCLVLSAVEAKAATATMLCRPPWSSGDDLMFHLIPR